MEEPSASQNEPQIMQEELEAVTETAEKDATDMATDTEGAEESYPEEQIETE